MRRNIQTIIASLVPLSLVWTLACSDDDGDDAARDSTVAVDSKVQKPDSKLSPDLGQLPDLAAKDPCESEWRDAISPQKTPSTGTVTTSDLSGGIKKTVVDASAGGSSTGAHNHPYVYISLTDGKRVDIDDFAAKKSTAWDMAFRRSVIRVNGGDSGAGKGAVAIFAAKKLADITTAPASASFAADDFLDSSCKIKRDPINNIWTAIGGGDGMWYDFNMGSKKLKPAAEAYVIRTATGSFVKLVIDNYYNASDQAAHFTLRWSPLK